MRLASKVLTAALLVAAVAQTAAAVTVAGSNSSLTMAGSFAAGLTLNIAVSGSIDLAGNGSFVTGPTGAIIGTVTASGYSYANAGASGYPTVDGGDGANHFPGGGANYDVLGTTPYGPAGAMTTDTTDPTAIRFGALVGTFVASPTRSDYFLVGSGGSFLVPGAGTQTLYLLVNDTFHPGNVGSYDVTITAVPEPSSYALMLAGLGLLAWAARRAPAR